MGKSTRPVYWDCAVITGHTEGLGLHLWLGYSQDMLDWAPRHLYVTA